MYLLYVCVPLIVFVIYETLLYCYSFVSLLCPL